MVASRAYILGCAAVLPLGQRLGRASGQSEHSCLWIQQGIDCSTKESEFVGNHGHASC